LLLIGAPGSGKSTFVHTHLKTYERVNQDTLGNADRCMKACRAGLTSGKSVVIDNTNCTAEQRSRYIEIAKSLKIPVRAIHLDTPKDRCMHNNKQRVNNVHRQHHSKKVADVIIHTFFKKFEPLNPGSEGIKEVITVPFAPGPFLNEEDKQAYFMLT
jgi:bifunctional polynucleotide phosphatase/kinase